MSTEARPNHEFTTPLRVLFGLVAIATFVSGAPWKQSNQLVALTTCAGSLMWAVMAAFGNKAGWKKHLTMGIAIAYLALVVAKIAGFGA